MKWYHYIFLFLGGAFVANFFPHFVHGISGETFPTPFANPPGRGLSPPFVNVLWALFNIVVGYFLLVAGRFSSLNRTSVIVAFIGFSAMALNLSFAFAGVTR
jgi:hypothetical protein